MLPWSICHSYNWIYTNEAQHWKLTGTKLTKHKTLSLKNIHCAYSDRGTAWRFRLRTVPMHTEEFLSPSPISRLQRWSLAGLLPVLLSLCFGSYFNILGAYCIMWFASAILVGVYFNVFGAYFIIIGAYCVMCGTYNIMFCAYFIIFGVDLNILGALIITFGTFFNCFLQLVFFHLSWLFSRFVRWVFSLSSRSLVPTWIETRLNNVRRSGCESYSSRHFGACFCYGG